MSKSNLTWNSTEEHELELVRVRVDFIFQSNNKNKKYLHLILLERKDLHDLVLGFGVYGRCLDVTLNKNLFGLKIFAKHEV